MKYLKILALSMSLAASGAWAADCTAPDAPEVPNGAKASYDDMVAGQQAVKEFQQNNKEYLNCMEQDISASAAAAKNVKASDDEKAVAIKQHNAAVQAYNAAIAREEKLAKDFNGALQEFKKAQK